MNERSKRVEITADNVLREIARLGFSDPRKLFDENGNLKPIHELDDDIAAAVAGIDVVVRGDGENALQVRKIKFWDKNNALEKLGKHLRLWTERHEHTGKDGGPIEMILTAYLDQIDGTSRGLPSPEEEAACPID
jgi:phage terminase small subunit